MEKKSSKKFIIAIAALAMVVCLSVGGLIGVLAAQAQQVTSSFNVQYTIGQNIAGKVSASYLVAGGSAIDLKAGDEKVISFDTTEGQHGAGDLTAYALNAEGDIALSPTATSVVFSYVFENTGATAYTVTLIDGCQKANVTVAYAATDNDDTTTDADLKPLTGIRVAAGKTATVTITVAVEQANLAAANYTSAAGNGITWNLSYVA